MATFHNEDIKLISVYALDYTDVYALDYTEVTLM